MRTNVYITPTPPFEDLNPPRKAIGKKIEKPHLNKLFANFLTNMKKLHTYMYIHTPNIL
ncbi:MAG: hypothetical protein RLZZ628_498 [Bacteroidota bacterium]|jgi:hypothetical protein